MVARTPPPRIKKMVAPPNPILLRETVNKVDKCMARLQELQYTVTGGTKVISGVSLSPRSSRVYLRTSLRCKQESARARNNYTPRKSPTGKLPTKNTGTLPAMLLGETVVEILQASQFAKEMMATVAPNSNITATNDPKTPITIRPNQRQNPENSELRARRKREKQPTLMQPIRSESDAPCLHLAKSSINFKVSPPRKTESEKENCRYMANRVSPRNKPWVKKTVIFPNPLFHSSTTSNHQTFGDPKCPLIAKNRPTTPHKFLVNSPASASKFQVKIKSPPLCLSPTRALSLSKKSPKVSAAAKLRRSFSPSRFSPTRALSLSKKSPKVSAAAKLRRSFSPSRLASRLVSPLKSTKSFVQKSDGMKIMMSGLKQRPQNSTPMKFIARRI